MSRARSTARPDSSAAATAADRPQPPPHRSLQIYAFDPSFDLDLDTARLNRSVIQVAWENRLEPGPVGEYVEVVDLDPASRSAYVPVNLNDPHLLATDGHAPSEGNPQFHQQMVYAVAMMTIGNFERALGRSVHWSSRRQDEAGEWLSWEQSYVPRLRIYPHALREANAYYSPDKKSLLFGYFNAQNADPREGFPGGLVFTCLSHDVIAHETTHAILDGIHRRMLEASNPDSLAFHEAFADLVAIFQHFTLPGLLEHQIARSRGDLRTENLLAKLAVQFGRATRRGNALRDVLGDRDPQTGQWQRYQRDPSRIGRVFEPHARGAILVAALFDAFFTIYQAHTADLVRIASGGTGRLPDGDLHPDLVGRLADEAGKVAQRVLTMCLRALDYLPPVDVTFGDYVRALITGDIDLVPDDPRHYRVAVISALRDWGIYPRDVRTLSVESLRWKRPDGDEQELLRALLPPVGMLRTMTFASDFAREGWQIVTEGRGRAGEALAEAGDVSHRLMEAYQNVVPARHRLDTADSTTGGGGPIENVRRRDEYLRERQFACYLHDYLLARTQEAAIRHERDSLADLLGIDLFAEDLKFEVHAVRPTTRVRNDGRTKTELLVLITQRTRHDLPLDGRRSEASGMHYKFRGGCTLLIDPESGDVRYAITKRIRSTGRRERQEAFLRERLEREGLHARGRYGVWLTGEDKVPQEPFRLLHRGELWDD